MLWFVLSLPSGIGVGLFMYGLPDIPPNIAMSSGVIIVLGCLWIGVREQGYKKRAAKAKDIFFNLNIPALKDALRYWGDSWDNVKKITLYSAPVNFPVIGSERIKYILHWECSKMLPMLKHMLSEGNWGCNEMLITDDQYKLIYKDPQHGEYRDEWHCVTKRPKGVDKRYSILLYPIK